MFVVAIAAARGDGGLQALAPPVHVPRQRHRARGPRGAAHRRVQPAPALRRHDHRPLAGLLAALGDGGVVSFTVVGIIYMLVVPGRPRTIAKVARHRRGRHRCRWPALYLGGRPPFDVLTGVALGVAIPLNAFRFFTPNEVVPGHVPRRQDRPPRRRRPARRGAPPGRRGPARRHRRSTSGRSAWPAPAARRRCACASPATPTRTCSGSSTR